MAADFLPNSDAELIAWAKNFNEKMSADAASFGFTNEETSEFKDLTSQFEAAYNENVKIQAQARASTEAKNALRQKLEAAGRARAKRIKASADITNEKLADLGLNIPDKESAPTGAPTSRPIV